MESKAVKMAKKEYGGYLPLEVRAADNNLWFDKYKDGKYTALNSGRACITAALLFEKAKRVHIPYYNCHVVEKMLSNYSFTTIKYYLDDEFMPIISDYDADCDWVVYVDYFGINNHEKKKHVIEKYKRVILDNTQAFFAEPFLYDTVYNVYSCRKFIGVADGAFLMYSKDKEFSIDCEKDISFERYISLLKSIEMGTNAGYKENLLAEESIGYTIKSMSDLTLRILKTVDYQSIRIKRQNNFNLLHEKLNVVNEFKFDYADSTPMIYPLLVSNKSIRQQLVEDKVYVPQWWKYLLTKVKPNSIESKFSNYLIPLPIDQRYTFNDMLEIHNTVIKYL